MALTPPPSSPPPAPDAPGAAPTRSDPGSFRILADAFVAWLVGFRGSIASLQAWLTSYISWAGTHITELTALQSDVAAKQAAADTSAGNAAALASAADGSASAAAGSASLAAGSASTASAAATQAQTAIPPVQVVDYAALRAYNGTATVLQVTGYLVSSAPTGIAGTFTRDDSDTTSADNGGTIIVASSGKRWKRVYKGALCPEWFGAKGDYYTAAGAVNPSKTDDTAALQAAINATSGNGALLLSSFYYTTALLQCSGILALASPLVPAVYSKSSLGRERPYGIANTTTNVFRVNPADAQSGIHMKGLTFIGNGANSMFDTAGQTKIDDYFNVTAFGCDFNGFGDNAIDGTLGSWLWKFQFCNFKAEGKLAVNLYQPHNALIEHCGFWFRNRQDLYAFGGQSFTVRNTNHDFDIQFKQIGLHFDSPQNLIYEGCYAEQYTGAAAKVNGGRGTDVVKITVDHFSQNCIQKIRNNYYAAANVGRLFTVLRDAAEESFNTVSTLRIEDITVNGLSGDFLYHDNTSGTGSLTMPRPLLQASQATSYTINDPTGTLRFKGMHSLSVLKYTAASPTHLASLSTASPTVVRDDKNYNSNANGWQITQGGIVTISFSWSSATARDFYVRISGGAQFTQVPLRQTGTKGGGTFTCTIPTTSAILVQLSFENVSGSSGSVCDSIEVVTSIQGITR